MRYWRLYQIKKRVPAGEPAHLSDAQDIGDILLDAEAKLGEILKAIKPKYEGSIVGSSRGTDEHKTPRQIRTLPENITNFSFIKGDFKSLLKSLKESHIAQTVANNPKIVKPSSEGSLRGTVRVLPENITKKEHGFHQENQC